ncbi:serine hydrolase domain-containing protein [Levilactobacillus namurensis]|uniref:serine hydrolase domain-containing protein n=1 Tax=Levilactobacillus namurensis TaxID=380393 RepID=UPI0022325208|nr:serine hydrolase domain-containing protein [Levilactobacillus namurensis]MCW3779568.1 beta-lactamase family protein [Levilactobacillus namurensis]
MKTKVGIFVVALVLALGLGSGLMYWMNSQAQSAPVKVAKVSSSSVSQVKPKKRAQPKRKATPKIKTTAATRKIDAILRANRFVGTAYVVHQNRPIYQKGFGYADATLQRKNNANSVYQLASVQKSFTAGLLMKLVAENKVALTDKLAKYYPQITGAQEITLRDMLDMKSGLYLEAFPNKLTNENQMIKFVLQHVISTPSKIGRWEYSPVNYMLIAGIIQQVSGQSYRQYFTENIIQPWGLTHTGFVFKMNHQADEALGYKNQNVSDVVPNYAHRYFESRTSMYYQFGTGQVYMSARDLYLGERNMLQGKLYPQADVNTLLTPGSASTYGGGDYIQPGYIRVHGLAYGYEATALLSKDGQDGVVLLTNYYRQNQLAQTPAVQIWNMLEAGQLTSK